MAHWLDELDARKSGSRACHGDPQGRPNARSLNRYRSGSRGAATDTSLLLSGIDLRSAPEHANAAGDA